MHTLEEVQAAVKAAVEAHPNRRNPEDPREVGCVYTGKGGAHCIAGQVLIDLGYDVPQWGDDCNGYGIVGLLVESGLYDSFTKQARAYLEEAQTTFDHNQNGIRPRWSAAYNRLQKVIADLDPEDWGEGE